MNDHPWDVVIIGAGAAGLMAAIRAAERNSRVLLLEKNRRPGVKILMSGGTRCNLTHATDNRGIVEAFGKEGKFLHSSLAALGVEETIALFEVAGVPTKVEETGKVFPVSNRAADVLNALLTRLHASGASLCLEESVRDLQRGADGLKIVTARRFLTARRAILTCGGMSYPGSGTTGDGYSIAAALGHAIVPPRPALVPIRVTAEWVKELRGITIPDVALSVVEQERVLGKRRGSLLFAHFGLTGPVALDASRMVTLHPRPTELHLEIDFLPADSPESLDGRLKASAVTTGRRSVAATLGEQLPRRLCETLLAQAAIDPERKMAELRREERARLVQMLKRARLSVSGTLGFEKAEVTSGGIALDEVDSRTLASKIVPGLHIAGEVLDLDGPIGGYNFQAAFSTGWLAGTACSQ
jgi:predicted Rossmann fold flavoprotein